MAEQTNQVTFSGGQVNPDLVYQGSDILINSSPRMENILYSNDGFRRRSGTNIKGILDVTISTFVGIQGNLVGSRFVTSGYFLIKDTTLFYYDFYLPELIVNIGDANDFISLRVVRLKDYIIFYNKDNLFCVNVLNLERFEWLFVQDYTSNDEIGMGRIYPSYNKRVYDAHHKIYSRLVKREQDGSYSVILNSNTTSVFFQIRAPTGFFRVDFLGAALSTTLINAGMDIEDVLKKTLKQEVLFNVLKIEKSKEPGYDLVTCSTVESASGLSLRYASGINPDSGDFLDGLTAIKDVTEFRSFVPPDVMGVIGGRLVAITGNTLCFSEANNPLNFGEILASNGSFDPSSLGITAYSELFSGVEEDLATGIINVNNVAVITFKDSIRVVYARDGIFVPTNIATVTQKISGTFVGEVDNLMFLNSKLHVLSVVEWRGEDKRFVVNRAFRYDQTQAFNAGVKKVLEVFDGSYMMVLLNNGKCLFVVRLENSRYGFQYSVFPMTFGERVLDIGYYNGLLYLFVLRNNGVSLETWEPGTGKEYDVQKGDIIGELDFYTYLNRNRVIPKQATIYIKPLGDLSGVILIYPDGKQSVVEVRSSEIGYVGNVYTGLPDRYTLRFREYNMRLTSLYYTFVFTPGR